MSAVLDHSVQAFVDALKAAFASTISLPPAAGHFLERLYAGLDAPVHRTGVQPVRRPVCVHLPAACEIARSASLELARLADAFEGISPSLAWEARPSGRPKASSNWPEGHANAVIIGSGGLQERGNAIIGASLLAPDVRYPDHNHPPEELYLVMTPGRFQHGDSAWCEPGQGGTFHNVPNIKHAMASGDVPLLAIWTMVRA